MTNVLGKIVADKRIEIAQRELELPLDDIIDQLTPSNRSLYKALAVPNAQFILECKKASPSKGLIRDNFDLDEIIAAYAPQAAAFSVLTDEKYFEGRFEYLRYVRQQVQQPVLNKDFFITAYQVHLARYHQADAILLMLSVLDDTEYRQLAELAAHYQLDVLTEVSNEQETQRAINLGAKIIGINNRNLRDLSTDLATTEHLVPLIQQSGHNCLIISESGIYTHHDVRRLAPLVQGFLVGSALMAQANLQQAVAQLVYGNIKVCGITNPADAGQVKHSPARYAGLIFVAQSKRYITVQQAQELVEQVPQAYVGVFANQAVHEVAAIATDLKLTAVQLHGNEDSRYISELKSLLTKGCQIWTVVRVKPNDQQIALPQDENIDKLLLDCQIGEQSGGTGQTFNWQLLNELDTDTPIILAGGLTPDNIQTAANTGVDTLDINSGVESSPGNKDHALLSKAFSQLRVY